MKFVLSLSLLVLIVFLFSSTNIWAKSNHIEDIVLTKQAEKKRADAVRQLLKQYRDNPHMFSEDIPENQLMSQCIGLEFLKFIHIVKESTLEQYPHWKGKRVKYTLKVGSRTVNSSFVFSDWSQRVAKASEICADVYLEETLPLVHIYRDTAIRDLKLLNSMQDGMSQGAIGCMMAHTKCTDMGGGMKKCSAGSMTSEQRMAEEQACTCRKLKGKRAEFKMFIVALLKKYPEWKNSIVHYIQSPHDFEAANFFLNFPFVEQLNNQTRCP